MTVDHSTVALATSLAGVRLANPVMTAAGCGGTGRDLDQLMDVAELGAFVTRTITLDARQGWPPPRMTETPSGVLHASGLHNPGLQGFLATELPWLAQRQVPAIVSVSAGTLAEYAELAGRLGDSPGVAAIEVVFQAEDPPTTWLAGLPGGAPLDVVGPLGRPYALPKEPVTCLLVAEGCAGAPLYALADRLRDRGCVVHMLLGAASEAQLFGALEARRAARTVTVTTEDGSVGITGRPESALADLLARTGADVVYAAGPVALLHAAAQAAEDHGSWSQTAVAWPTACATGLCHACVLPVVGEDGVSRLARACAEGPVFRGDRVRWAEVAGVPLDPAP